MTTINDQYGRAPINLTKYQQDLLDAAIASNLPPQKDDYANPLDCDVTLASSFIEPSILNKFDSHSSDYSSFLEAETSLGLDKADFDHVNTYDVDLHEKRKHSDTETDDDSADHENDVKRQEGHDKQVKRPSRKSAVAEPTTKRKQQNRAAQKAFRERKERHLNDLETRVAELTKSALSEKHENGLLRAQVLRLTSELGNYKKRLSADVNRPKSPSKMNVADNLGLQFDFPPFGVDQQSSPDNAPLCIPKQECDSFCGNGSLSQLQECNGNSAPTQTLFNPDFLNNLEPVSATSNNTQQNINVQTQVGSKDDGTDNTSGIPRVFRFNSVSSSSKQDSSSHASPSPFNRASSSDTSPPSSHHPSPPKEPLSAITMLSSTTNNMTSSNTSVATPTTLNGIGWLASQNGNQFDPVLFGNYRESQDAVIGHGDFDGGFFNDSFPYDFTAPLAFPDFSSSSSSSSSEKPAPAPLSNDTAPLEMSQACKDALAKVNASANGLEDFFTVGTDGSVLTCPIAHGLQLNSAELDSICEAFRSKTINGMSGPELSGHQILNEAFRR